MEKPILFNTEMVKAILDGRKTMTRRIIKPQPIDTSWFRRIDHVNGAVFEWSASTSACVRKLPYQVGDILWVRETWKVDSINDSNPAMAIDFRAIQGGFHGAEVICKFKPDRYKQFRKFYQKNGWQSSLFMPREAARLFLRTKNVRVERLQDIDHNGTIAEGIYCDPPQPEHLYPVGFRKCFIDLWDSTIKKQDIDKYGWDANPWVWVIEFERVKGA